MIQIPQRLLDVGSKYLDWLLDWFYNHSFDDFLLAAESF